VASPRHAGDRRRASMTPAKQHGRHGARGDFRLTSLLAGCTDRRQCRRRGSGLAAAARRGSARDGWIVGSVFAVIEVESGHGAADPVREVAAVSASCRRLGKAGR